MFPNHCCILGDFSNTFSSSLILHTSASNLLLCYLLSFQFQLSCSILWDFLVHQFSILPLISLRISIRLPPTWGHVEPHLCLGSLGSPWGSVTTGLHLCVRLHAEFSQQTSCFLLHFLFSCSTQILLRVRVVLLSVCLSRRPSVMCGVSIWDPLCQALGFPIPTMIFHSRGSRSRELNPSGLSSCFWIPLLCSQPAQPCFSNTVRSVCQDI